MSLLSDVLPFRRRNTSGDKAQNVAESRVVPVGLNDAHSFVQPGPAPFTELPYGRVQYGDQLEKDLPDLAYQDRILVHYFQPPADENPQRWYNDRNEDRIYRGTQEHFYPNNIPEGFRTYRRGDNPFQGPTPQENSHYNAGFSPSNYRFVRPFDQQWERTFTLAQTGSMAVVAYALPVGGMQPQERLRNTFRIAPTAMDLENLDVNATNVASVQPAVYVSPQVQSSPWGL